MLVLVLAPLASKIKVFEFLEFQKSVDRIDGELAANREEITTVANNLQVLQLNINTVSENRQAQTITLNLHDEATIEALRQRIKIETEEVLEDSENPPEFALSPAYRFRSYLQVRLAMTISEIKTGLFVHYVYCDAMANGHRTDIGSSAMELDLPKLIDFFRKRGNLYRHDEFRDEEDIEYLNRLEALNDHLSRLTREIRSMMPSKEELLDQSTQGPDMETIRTLSLESEMLKAYFLGGVAGITSSFGVISGNRPLEGDQKLRDASGSERVSLQDEHTEDRM